METLKNLYQSVTKSAGETSPVTTFLTVAGAFSLSIFFGRLLIVLLDVYVLPGRSVSSFKKNNGAEASASSSGPWAVVTGATDGIGLEFALQLSKKGYNIFLASRSAEKLGRVAGQIESQSTNVKTKTHAIDFSKPSENDWAHLEKELEELDVAILINNVGKSHDTAVFFNDTDQDEIDAILNINVTSTLRVTSIVLPKLRERKNGLILNMGSFAGNFPTPLLATYSGSKSFLIGWTQALAEEERKNGVIVQLSNAFYVSTAMSKIRKSSVMVPTAKQYVAASLGSIGKAGGAIGRAHTQTPWHAHAIADWAISYIVPQKLMLSQSLKMQLQVKKRADRKKAKASKSK